jgi:hypothetical protein
VQRTDCTNQIGVPVGHGNRSGPVPRTPSGGAPEGKRRRGCREPYAEAVSSSKKPRVLFGSTGMPGAMVDVKVIFFRYLPLAAAGLSLITSSSAAP